MELLFQSQQGVFYFDINLVLNDPFCDEIIVMEIVYITMYIIGREPILFRQDGYEVMK